jgi:hypothetical protein
VSGKQTDKERALVKQVQRVNDEFWEQQNPSPPKLDEWDVKIANTHAAIRHEKRMLLESQESEQALRNAKIARPAVAGRRAIGKKTRESVRAAALLLPKGTSRPTGAKLIAPKVHISESRALKILTEEKLLSRPAK